MAQALVGDVDSVFGYCKTFVEHRPVATGGSGYFSKADAYNMRAVENDDTTLCMLTFDSGAIGSMSCSRVATGRRAWLTYEIQGTKGAVYFTQQRMNELQLYRRTEPARERGYKTIRIGPEHGVFSYFHKTAGAGLGYNDLKVIEAYEIMSAISEKRPASPDFGFAAKISQIVDAVLLSAEEERWVTLDELEVPMPPPHQPRISQ
jgi:predicted dehydrogenase